MRAKYVLSEMATGLWRNVTMTVAMIITMAVSLTMLAASLLMYMQVNKLKDYYYAKVEVTIYLDADVTDQQRTSLEADLRADPLVKNVIYESKETAFSRFKTMFRDAPEFVNSTKPNGLPESFRVKLRDPKQFKAISDKYVSREGVDDIIDQRKLVVKLFRVLGSVQHISLIAAIFQGVAALLLVANTIQVAAYSKRREVSVMKLVGASNWFIQSPFVLEAVFAGVIGSILAFAMLALAKVFILDGSLKVLSTVFIPIGWRSILLMLPILAGISAVISAVTGWITLRFYVRV